MVTIKKWREYVIELCFVCSRRLFSSVRKATRDNGPYPIYLSTPSIPKCLSSLIFISTLTNIFIKKIKVMNKLNII
jgi:hypothetical protein